MPDKQNVPAAPPADEFHIGFTMAGAASAGCYTAGAMDYFFEIMELWENAKNGILPDGWDNSLLSLVPKHKVTVDAMGGTSAGGMTTVMAAIYALAGKVNPVNDPVNPGQKKNNVLYDSWVLMGDEPNKPGILEKTLCTTDLDNSNKIQSLLNSDFIDSICDNAFKTDASASSKLPYVAGNLELILSHTMLRGVPLGVDFTTPASQLRRKQVDVDHSSFDHFTISHFKLDYDDTLHKHRYLPLDPFNAVAAQTLKLATMATGAFPVGLKFREFFGDELTTDYIKNTAEKITFNRLSDIPSASVPQLRLPTNFPNPYQFVSIDGGAINNEPFGEVLGILKERYGKKSATDPYKYALVMIDPFPDVPDNSAYRQPDDLFSVVPAIIGTLWDQSKVKRAEMLDAYSADYFRGEIYPVRWIRLNNGEPHPIACGAAMAFSGLLDISFRHHDFFLGRDNARNFYRTFFSMPYNPSKGIVHPIHKDWTPTMVNMFSRPTKENGTVLLPVIPDLYMLKEKFNGGKERNPLQRTVPEWPKYDATQLFKVQDKMEARVKKMLELSYAKLKAGSTVTATPLTDDWISENYSNNWWNKLKGWVGGGMLRVLFKWNKGKIASRITRSAIEWVLKELESKKLLKNVR